MSLFQIYDEMVRQQRITDDPSQRRIVEALEQLRQQLLQEETSPNPITRLFKKPSSPVRGAYIWGSVGRGKSMLMDLFFDHIPIPGKRRVHFHAFMQEVYARIHALRQDSQRSRAGIDPVVALSQQIADETPLLCFDELQATDVADATLLYRLFHGLFDAGVAVVSTSNRPPANLYTGGIQAERFQKFIALLEERMQVMELVSTSDYRLLQPKDLQQVYFTPAGKAGARFIENVLMQLCPGCAPQKGRLSVHGRTLYYTHYNQHIGQFTFAELCGAALGAADYLAIANHFKTVIISDIPRLPPEKRNEAKRFVTLVDALYEHRVKLICTAEAGPEQIYAGGDGSFEFQRTVSRLMEMQSMRYLQA